MQQVLSLLHGADPWQIPAAGTQEDWMPWGLEHYAHLCDVGTPYLLRVCCRPSPGHDFSLHSVNEEPKGQMVKEAAQDGPGWEGGK